MFPSLRSSFALLAVLLAATSLSSAQCTSTQPVHLCCRGVAPWSTNSAVWGGICGVFPEDPETIMGGACIQTFPCPVPGTTEVCCSSVSPCGSGGLGNNCFIV